MCRAHLCVEHAVQHARVEGIRPASKGTCSHTPPPLSVPTVAAATTIAPPTTTAASASPSVAPPIPSSPAESGKSGFFVKKLANQRWALYNKSYKTVQSSAKYDVIVSAFIECVQGTHKSQVASTAARAPSARSRAPSVADEPPPKRKCTNPYGRQGTPAASKTVLKGVRQASRNAEGALDSRDPAVLKRHVEELIRQCRVMVRRHPP